VHNASQAVLACYLILARNSKNRESQAAIDGSCVEILVMAFQEDETTLFGRNSANLCLLSQVETPRVFNRLSKKALFQEGGEISASAESVGDAP
jgi:hypothetical protein